MSLSIERVLARDKWIVAGCVALIAALAWFWLWRESLRMSAAGAMAGMDMSGMDMSGMDMAMATPAGPAAYIGAAFLMWFIMMIAMMLPSASPMILLYAGLARGQRGQGAGIAPTAVFAGTYLAIWAGFSAAAALAQWLLARSGAVSDMTLALGDRRVAGVLLIGAGVYQATALKRACLDNCRSPLSFVMRRWRPGWAGAARLGIIHGVYCLGCCAALMALLFVFGVMNLVWVAALALFVAFEKVVPLGPRMVVGSGYALIVAGLIMVCYGAASGAG